MTKRDKLIERMRGNPQSIRFEEIETLLLGLGFVKRKGLPATLCSRVVPIK